MHLLLVRHGQSENNVIEAVGDGAGGSRDQPLVRDVGVPRVAFLEELADLVGGLLGGLGRVADGLLGPAPVPIPIPVEDERDQAPEQPPVGTDPYKYPGTY